MEREQIDWQDRDIRRKASLVGTAIRDDGTSQKVVVTNLSYHGCHLFSEEAMHQGDTFKLVIPTMGKLEVQIRWAKGESAGARFLVEGSVAEQRRARLGF